MKISPSAIVLLFLLFTWTTFGQHSADAFITVEGEVTRPLTLPLADLEKLPSHGLKANDKEGREHNYQGTLLSVALDAAGVTLGLQLRGEHLAKLVLIQAADGYEVIYSLAEIDPELSSNTVLLATQVDGAPLPPGEGPFRLINPSDKRPARWIREIVPIKILFPKD